MWIKYSCHGLPHTHSSLLHIHHISWFSHAVCEHMSLTSSFMVGKITIKTICLITREICDELVCVSYLGLIFLWFSSLKSWKINNIVRLVNACV